MVRRKRRAKSEPIPWVSLILKWIGIPFLVLLIYAALILGESRFLLPQYFSLTGFPFGERNYLIVVQNDDVLRPTGGAIVQYGILHFQHGFYGGIDWLEPETFKANPGLNIPEGIELLLQDQEGRGFTFEYANFNPDFPQASQDLLSFSDREQSELTLDGVIAIDQSTLEEWKEQFPNGVSMIFPWQVHSAMSFFADEFQEKHIQAVFFAEGLKNAFAQRDYSGELPQVSAGDFFGLNIADYGGGSSELELNRQVTYQVDFLETLDKNGHPEAIATVTVSLTHLGQAGAPGVGPFVGYLRVMIPKATEIMEGSEYHENSSKVQILGDLISLNPGQTALYTYQYELPDAIWYQGAYLLQLYKQAGTETTDVQVIVHAPLGQSILSEDFQIEGNLARFDGNLEQDISLTLDLTEAIFLPTRDLLNLPAVRPSK